MGVKERLSCLRKLMEEKGIDFYVIPTADFHQSEYVGEYFKARKYMTGFSGSAGTAVISKDWAGMWTDGRYFIQAAKQMEGTTVELMKMREPGVPTIEEYLEEHLSENGVIGFDGRVVSMGEGLGYETIARKKNGGIVYEYDLVDQFWEDRPKLSEEPAFILEEKYAGESVADKLKRIREVMKEEGADIHILTTLDDICWTLNMRGNDIDFFPMVLSYAVITMDEMLLYIDERKLSDEMKAIYAKDGVTIHPYNAIYEDMKHLSIENTALLDASKTNYAIYKNIPEEMKKVDTRNPEILFKAIKNPVEIENIRKAQIKDSIAHVRFMKWLKENVGKMKITEMSASDKLDELRVEQGNFIRPSFEPISAYGEHAALCHYTSSKETDVELKEGNVFLTDTGAGFYEGSTDITRTYVLGEIPNIMKEHFTLVAISNLQLASAKMLKGCNGMNLDILARKPFWDRALNFNHGTGHGMGYLLNIHEGPTNFRWAYRKNDTHQFEPGIVITDEPGIYIEGSHGVRLENELLVKEWKKNEYGEFLCFETITYVPMDLDGIKADMMSEEEKRLLNDYHALVYEKIAPHLNEEEREWLKKYTRAI